MGSLAISACRAAPVKTPEVEEVTVVEDWPWVVVKKSGWSFPSLTFVEYPVFDPAPLP